MLSQLVKRNIARSSAQFTRSFSQATPRFNSIQDLYVKELQSFKPAAWTAKDAEGSVKPWSAPIAPKAPGLEADAATQLGEYESAPVEVVSETKSEEGAEVTEEWFVLEEIHEEAH